ncbi:MAG: hypothetical protein AB1679_36190, partial [Actinomycetota bacterium]
RKRGSPPGPPAGAPARPDPAATGAAPAAAATAGPPPASGTAGPPPAASAPAASGSTAAPEPADGAGGESGPLTLDDVIAAWAKALDGFRPRLKAMAKEAHPVRVDGDTVVVGLPSRFEKVHLPTITGESATVAGALSELLGRRVRLSVVLDDNVVSPSGDGPPSGSVPADVEGGAEALVAEMTRPPEPGGGGRGVDSPIGLVIETFGASVESETVRE